VLNEFPRSINLGILTIHQELASASSKNLLVKKYSKIVKGLRAVSDEQTKAILRGGTFHRVQVLLEQGQSYIEHCGLNYKVTQQKDASGRTICIWSRE